MRPKLRNSVYVTIEPLDRAGTVHDPLADEPFHPIARLTTVRVLAQVEHLQENDRQPGPGGSEVPVLALITFDVKCIERAGYTPQDGDRVIKEEARKGPAWERPLNWYLRGPRPIAQGGRGRPTLIQARAVDGTPARNANDGLVL